MNDPDAAPLQRPSLPAILATFLRIGLTSFGGSTQPFMHREVVERRGWMTDRQFFTGLTIALVLPGANPVNLALYVGLELRGGLGATLAIFGLVAPAWCTILLLGWLYSAIGHLEITHVVLTGMAAVGIGSTFQLGAKAARRLDPKAATIVIAIAMFVMVGLLRWPLVPVVLISTPLSILIAWLTDRGAENA